MQESGLHSASIVWVLFLGVICYENATVIYTEKTAWVCIPTQPLPKSEDLFITLFLKEKK